MIYTTIGFVSYVAWARPFDSFGMNFLEVFNEVIILLCLYHMLIFTEGLTQDKETLYTVGWSMDIVLVIHFILNIFMIAYQFFQTVVSMIKRFVRVQKMKAMKAAKEAQELTEKQEEFDRPRNMSENQIN